MSRIRETLTIVTAEFIAGDHHSGRGTYLISAVNQAGVVRHIYPTSDSWAPALLGDWRRGGGQTMVVADVSFQVEGQGDHQRRAPPVRLFSIVTSNSPEVSEREESDARGMWRVETEARSLNWLFNFGRANK